jgi:hypothetical protein
MARKRASKVAPDRMSPGKIRAQLRAISPEGQRTLLFSIVTALYGEGSDPEWSADTTDQIAQRLHISGIGPSFVGIRGIR